MRTIPGEAPVNGTIYRYDVTGTGHPFVMIHGGLMDRRMWEDQLPVFAREYKVIRVDLRGFGGSAAPTEPFSYVDDLHELLSQLDTGPVYLMGLSLGAMVAEDFTIAHPELVDALLLAGAPLRGLELEDVEGTEEKLIEVIRTYRRGAVDSAIGLALELPFFQPASQNPDAALRMAEMVRDNFGNWLQSLPMIQWDSTTTADRISEIDVPTLIIVGDEDVQSIRFAADSLVAGIANSRKVVVKGTRHHLNMEAPEAFNTAVAGFLEEIKAAR